MQLCLFYKIPSRVLRVYCFAWYILGYSMSMKYKISPPQYFHKKAVLHTAKRLSCLKILIILVATTAAAAIQGGSIFCRAVQSGRCEGCARLPRNVVPRSCSGFGLPLQSATCAWVVDGGVQSCGAAKTNGGRGNRDVDDWF